MSITYSLVLNSADRIGGSHNNPTFNIGWCELLPEKIKLYNIKFTFQTVGGYYKDSSANDLAYQSAFVYADFGSRSFSCDTSTDSPSLLLGIIRRSFQNATSIAVSLSCTNEENPKRTITSPASSQVSFRIINQHDGELLVNTDASAGQTTDMTPWTAIFEFIPIFEDVKKP
jgi:hypothetical protein